MSIESLPARRVKSFPMLYLSTIVFVKFISSYQCLPVLSLSFILPESSMRRAKSTMQTEKRYYRIINLRPPHGVPLDNVRYLAFSNKMVFTEEPTNNIGFITLKYSVTGN